MVYRRRLMAITAAAVLAAAIGCGRKPAATPGGPPPTPAPFPGAVTEPPVVRPPETTPPVAEPPPPSRPAPVSEDPLAAMSVDEVNRGALLKPVFFLFDSDQLDGPAREILQENARLLKKYPTWIITIEGHCDERGSAEYNLALGDRRALAASTYLISLGIAADRIRTVSYGKEFPFDPGQGEAAWALNRRAQFMVTAK